jgi:hypothetical protein
VVLAATAIAGTLLLGGCGSRPASLARDLGVPVDVAEVADAHTTDATVPTPDSALGCADIPRSVPPPVACNDGTGLSICCAGQLGDPCDPCARPYKAYCYTPCKLGLHMSVFCRGDGRGGWVLSLSGNLNLILEPCTADDMPLLVDGGPVTVAQQPCNDGTGRTNCCPPGRGADVACVLPDPRMGNACWTPCEAGTTTGLSCYDFFLPGDPVACGPDGGPEDAGADLGDGPDVMNGGAAGGG